MNALRKQPLSWPLLMVAGASLGALACSRTASSVSLAPAPAATSSADTAHKNAEHVAPAASAPPVASAPLLARGEGEVVTFTGMCDASGAVPLSNRRFVVADDEDNVLRVYDVEQGGAPVARADVSSGLKLPVKPKKKPGKVPIAPEADIEAATRLGDRAYFITSHARNSSGKLKPERLRFFATTAPENGEIQVIGEPYDGILSDIMKDPRLAEFELGKAAELAPKAEGGLNLEGMTERKEGGVWLGFRNPIPKGRALLVPLLNPEELIQGKPARLGDPLTLDLGGLGVRSLSSYRGRYLIVAGHFAQGAASRLFVWDGAHGAEALNVDLQGFNPEGFFTPEGLDRIMLLSDDGGVAIEGKDCKRLKDPEAKRFRGVWVSLAPAPR